MRRATHTDAQGCHPQCSRYESRSILRRTTSGRIDPGLNDAPPDHIENSCPMIPHPDRALSVDLRNELSFLQQEASSQRYQRAPRLSTRQARAKDKAIVNPHWSYHGRRLPLSEGELKPRFKHQLVFTQNGHAQVNGSRRNGTRGHGASNYICSSGDAQRPAADKSP